MHDTQTTKGRLLAKLLRETLATDSFDTLADLTDVLKTRGARLHLRLTADDISEAYRLVGSNRPLVRGARLVPVPHAAPAPPPASRAEAQRILAIRGVDVSDGHFALAQTAAPTVDTHAPTGFPRLVRVQ
jgi:hypothetical protein